MMGNSMDLIDVRHTIANLFYKKFGLKILIKDIDVKLVEMDPGGCNDLIKTEFYLYPLFRNDSSINFSGINLLKYTIYWHDQRITIEAPGYITIGHLR